eukprot:2873654-Rhodomonas_salina.2
MCKSRGREREGHEGASHAVEVQLYCIALRYCLVAPYARLVLRGLVLVVILRVLVPAVVLRVLGAPYARIVLQVLALGTVCTGSSKRLVSTVSSGSSMGIVRTVEGRSSIPG